MERSYVFDMCRTLPTLTRASIMNPWCESGPMALV
eukprot:CAMPEP_0195050126 /NCGR_PEP_ID=MMETSP0347-20130606/63792_1 /TAXON_ID=2932 /ORGANISM="Alexandrium fundyense, Strain CCMP1719" /LENGTH=34 /DNA_ID= /DNA_START= /DNA_END= /DNA_ORIENTATION=